MPKKSAPKSKESLKRSREEQWRRRAAAQGGVPVGQPAPAGGVVDDGLEDLEGPVEAAPAPRPRPAGRAATPAAPPRGRLNSPVASGAQRKATVARPSARLRMAANTMTIDEEMTYVRADIRQLIILTVVCLVLLVALSFVID